MGVGAGRLSIFSGRALHRDADINEDINRRLTGDINKKACELLFSAQLQGMFKVLSVNIETPTLSSEYRDADMN